MSQDSCRKVWARESKWMRKISKISISLYALHNKQGFESRRPETTLIFSGAIRDIPFKKQFNYP